MRFSPVELSVEQISSVPCSCKLYDALRECRDATLDIQNASSVRHEESAGNVLEVAT